jgi:hypothetical protein
MQFEVDRDVQAVLEYMQQNIPASKLATLRIVLRLSPNVIRE